MKKNSSGITPVVMVLGGGFVLLAAYVLLRPRTAHAAPLPAGPGTTAIPETRLIPPVPTVISQTTLVRQVSPLPRIGVSAATDRSVFMVVQKQLKDLGYHITMIDGILGRETWAAMTAWAHAKNFPISSSGVSPDIISAIDADYGTSMATS